MSAESIPPKWATWVPVHSVASLHGSSLLFLIGCSLPSATQPSEFPNTHSCLVARSSMPWNTAHLISKWEMVPDGVLIPFSAEEGYGVLAPLCTAASTSSLNSLFKKPFTCSWLRGSLVFCSLFSRNSLHVRESSPGGRLRPAFYFLVFDFAYEPL